MTLAIQSKNEQFTENNFGNPEMNKFPKNDLHTEQHEGEVKLLRLLTEQHESEVKLSRLLTEQHEGEK